MLGKKRRSVPISRQLRQRSERVAVHRCALEGEGAFGNTAPKGLRRLIRCSAEANRWPLASKRSRQDHELISYVPLVYGCGLRSGRPQARSLLNPCCTYPHGLSGLPRPEQLRQLLLGKGNGIRDGRIVRNCRRSSAVVLQGFVLLAQFFVGLAHHALDKRIVLVRLF
jgi:hypothetical protein